MISKRPSRIVLTGFSGSGKSLVAPIVAERLGWAAGDTDPRPPPGGGSVVCLEARPETVLQRLREGTAGDPLDRPLLAGPDPLHRIRELKAARQPVSPLAAH